MAFVEFRNVSRTYTMGEVPIRAVEDVSFEIEKGETCVIIGPSGAGKTTLLNILGGMDSPSSGIVSLDGKKISSFNKKELTVYRRFDIGFVFQFYNLVQNLTARENVEISASLVKDPLDIDKVMEGVGLADRKKNFPSQLSGGEQQRVAIARALAKNPKLMLCDEPTGALDDDTGKSILKLLQDSSAENGTTLIIVTHNHAITPIADRIIQMRSGTIESVSINDNPEPVENIEW